MINPYFGVLCAVQHEFTMKKSARQRPHMPVYGIPDWRGKVFAYDTVETRKGGSGVWQIHHGSHRISMGDFMRAVTSRWTLNG
ncbi:MAG: hypothetical protein ABI767_11170 [Rhodanobacter sp.]